MGVDKVPPSNSHGHDLNHAPFQLKSRDRGLTKTRGLREQNCRQRSCMARVDSALFHHYNF
jgi:hypothetical protein